MKELLCAFIKKIKIKKKDSDTENRPRIFTKMCV